MQILNSNRKTTIIGVALAVVWYLKTNGVQLPATKAEWWNFAIAILFVALGALVKDYDVTGGTQQAK